MHARLARAFGLLAVASLAVAACGSDAADEAPPTTTWASLGKPREIPATEPGLLVLGPPGAELAPGTDLQLTTQLYDSDATTQLALPSSLVFTSSAPNVVLVDATGKLHGVAQGESEIVVTDGRHGIARVWVAVSDSPHVGATGISCRPFVTATKLGLPTPIPAIANDARGNAVDVAGLTFATADGASIGADRTITIQKPGAYPIVARTPDGRVLDGSCIVVTRDGGPRALSTQSTHLGLQSPAAPAGCTISATPTWTQCWGTRTPVFYSRPGLEAELRISVIEGYALNCPQNPLAIDVEQLTQRAPFQADVDVQGIVSIGADGLLRSDAPGATHVRLSANGVECSVFNSTVSIDPFGDWAVDCPKKGYKGSIHSTYPQGSFDTIDTRWHDETSPAAGAVSGGARFVADGTGCFQRNDGSDACTDKASVETSTNSFPPGRCPSLESCGIGSSHCRVDRVGGGGKITGPDSFESEDCKYTRGVGPVACEQAAPKNISFTMNGITWSTPPREGFCNGGYVFVGTEQAGISIVTANLSGASGVGTFPIVTGVFGLEFAEVDNVTPPVPEKYCDWAGKSGNVTVTKFDRKPSGEIDFEAKINAIMEPFGSVEEPSSPCFGRSPTADLTATIQCPDYRH